MLSGAFLAGDGETGLSEGQQVASVQVRFVVQGGKVMASPEPLPSAS